MNSAVKQRRFFYWLNICIPLLVGLILYLSFRKDAFISVFWGKYLPLPAPLFKSLPEWLSLFLRNYASDILWAYSLGFAIQLVLGRSKRSRLHTLVVCLCFEVILEVLQRFGVIRGTFDYLDILLEACSICLALLVIKVFEEAQNEKNNQGA